MANEIVVQIRMQTLGIHWAGDVVSVRDQDATWGRLDIRRPFARLLCRHAGLHNGLRLKQAEGQRFPTLHEPCAAYVPIGDFLHLVSPSVWQIKMALLTDDQLAWNGTSMADIVDGDTPSPILTKRTGPADRGVPWTIDDFTYDASQRT